MENMKSFGHILLNVLVTFGQAGFAAWAMTNFSLDKAVIGGVIGAALSVVFNTIVKPFLISNGYLKG